MERPESTDASAAALSHVTLGEDTDVMKISTDFTPEVSMNKPGNISYRFRVQGPGTYQCALTRLVFDMTQQGQLLYRIIPWDEDVLQSNGKTPAGPLYSIQCPEDAVSQLHLPHCETQPALNPGGLSVVHFSDDGMSFLEPLLITDSHVVVNVSHLSAFGLVWDLIGGFLNIDRPIKSQVQLFRRTKQNQTVHVFLLADNVPLTEVKGQHKDAEHMVTPSSCRLSKDHAYSLQCREANIVQPATAQFYTSYGPNYHPTFEIRLSPSITEATVTVLDQKKTPVWDHKAKFTGSCPSGQHLPYAGNVQGEEATKLFSVRTELINRVSSPVVKDLLHILLQHGVINPEEMESIQETQLNADKTQKLVDVVLAKGSTACKVLIDALCELDPYLSKTLQLK